MNRSTTHPHSYGDTEVLLYFDWSNYIYNLTNIEHVQNEMFYPVCEVVILFWPDQSARYGVKG